MWKKLFSEHGVKNTVTLFHKANSPSSSRVLTLLKQANATAMTTATEDQASAHHDHTEAQNTEFELDIVEGLPTGDQLRSIMEYVGDQNAATVVDGATGEADAQRRFRMDANTLKRPLTVDWNAGKVVVGDNESELMKMIKANRNSD